MSNSVITIDIVAENIFCGVFDWSASLKIAVDTAFDIEGQYKIYGHEVVSYSSGNDTFRPDTIETMPDILALLTAGIAKWMDDQNDLIIETACQEEADRYDAACDARADAVRDAFNFC